MCPIRNWARKEGNPPTSTNALARKSPLTRGYVHFQLTDRGRACGLGSHSQMGFESGQSTTAATVFAYRIMLERKRIELLMTIAHGTDRRYSDGCRCDKCREAHKIKAREYRNRQRRGLTRPALLTAVMSMEQSGPGPVELAVETELASLAQARERPGLAQVALALARLMDGPAVTAKPAAAQRLVEILTTLSKGSSQRRQKLAAVKQMTGKGGA
jgi:hypothetical protein